MLPIGRRRNSSKRAEKFMSRTGRTKLVLLALSLAFLPVYGHDTTPVPPPPDQSAPHQTDAQAPRPTDSSAKKDGDKKDNDDPLPASAVHNPVLWQDPGDISSRDLFFGQGGEKHQPKPPYVFVREA